MIVVTRYRAEFDRARAREDPHDDEPPDEARERLSALRHEALLVAMDTAGRTVFFAGITVMIALLGLLLLDLSFMQGAAIAAALAVLFTMLAALTLLPAMLSKFGGWIDRLRLTFPGRRRRAATAAAIDPGESPIWARWSENVQRRPWPPLVVALLILLSVFIPLKAAVMNLLSIGAALGFVTLVFQDGFLAGALDVGTGPVESFVPVMLFAIVFGLSMDYEVFLVSRIHEEWLRTGDASRAVRNGIATTGRVITAAASIMIVVFLVFALLGGERVIKEFGLGLAVAVLLDALIIRCLLVPALMQVVGRRAWAFPTWLDRRLPRVAIEPE